MTEYGLDFPRANPLSPAEGVIKQVPDDFYVEEVLDEALSGSGEHVCLWIEKVGQNTGFVAKKLAEFAGVREMDVGYSGLKDRWAQTRQWFSIYLGKRDEPEWENLDLEGVTVLRVIRHLRKLRRGIHGGNRFRIVVRDLKQADNLEAALQKVSEQGFPNYFGMQRFGREGSNLDRAEQLARKEIKASRSQKSFYLSAARSYLFNLNLAQAVTSGQWIESDATGPLYGDENSDVMPLSASEKTVLEGYPDFADLIHQNRMRLERRPYRVLPESMSWSVDGDMLVADFFLPSGVFATSLLAEVLNVHVASGEK